MRWRYRSPMASYTSLTLVHWPTLQRLRAEAIRAGNDPAVLHSILPTVVPFVSEEERSKLAAAEVAGAPFGAVLSVKLRTAPQATVDAAVEWLTRFAPNLL